jgi:hypothetical protein
MDKQRVDDPTNSTFVHVSAHGSAAAAPARRPEAELALRLLELGLALQLKMPKTISACVLSGPL